jgi:hypothetical protein
MVQTRGGDDDEEGPSGVKSVFVESSRDQAEQALGPGLTAEQVFKGAQCDYFYYDKKDTGKMSWTGAVITKVLPNAKVDLLVLKYSDSTMCVYRVCVRVVRVHSYRTCFAAKMCRIRHVCLLQTVMRDHKWVLNLSRRLSRCVLAHHPSRLRDLVCFFVLITFCMFT